MPVSVGSACFVMGSAYALGCCTTGYYLVRLRTGQDIRQVGSGSVGASNVGRILGAWGFAVTFLGDAVKGALAVWIAHGMTDSIWLADAALIAVVAGHIWPLPLGGRGGKGVATSLGALTVLDARLTLLLLASFGAGFVLSRHKMGSALAAILLCPILAGLLHFPPPRLLGLAVLACLLITADRSNLRAGMFRASPPVHLPAACRDTPDETHEIHL